MGKYKKPRIKSTIDSSFEFRDTPTLLGIVKFVGRKSKKVLGFIKVKRDKD